MPTDADLDDLIQILTDHYATSGRHDMQWRLPEQDGSFDPYKILVSELMLQQTQVSRVTPKFAAFIAAFPTVQDLASAQLGTVLTQWLGLGYNRRAKYLWQAAQMVSGQLEGVFPHQYSQLLELPGVGPGTAGAIMAYSYDQPVVYLETNIRSVIIYHGFLENLKVHDKDIRLVVQRLLTRAGLRSDLTPRTFYWAMMDYGSYLKRTVGNHNRASASYSKQSTFVGSRRQLRGAIIRQLSAAAVDLQVLKSGLQDGRTESVIDDLISEGLVKRRGNLLALY